MTISVVQTVKIPDAWSGSFTANVTAGNTIFLVVTTYSSTGLALSSSAPQFNGASVAGASQLISVPSPTSGGGVYTSIWMLPNVSGGAKGVSITVTNQDLPPNAGAVGLIAHEVSGLGASPVMDKSHSSTGSTTAVTSGASGSITGLPEIVLGSLVSFGNVMTPVGAPWTENQFTSQYSLDGYQIVTSGSSSFTYAKTAATAGNWSGAIVTVTPGAATVTTTGSVGMSGQGLSGTVSVPIVASGSAKMGAQGVSGAGSVSVISTGSAGMIAQGVSGVASVPGAPVTSTGSVRMSTQGVAGTVGLPVTATGSVRMGAFGVSGSGTLGGFDSQPVPPSFPAGENDVKAELFLGTTWTDISQYVFQDTTQIQRGHPDESTTAAPSTFTATLDNSDGRFSSLNPLGPYYGLLGLNTPIRVSEPEGSTYMRLERDSASGAFCPSSTGINGITSFEVWIDVDADNFYTPQILAAKYASGTNQRSWALMLPGDGTIQLIVSTNGTSDHFSGSGAKIPIVHGRMSIRASYNQTTGNVTFYTGSYCSSWVVFGTGFLGTSLTPFASTTAVELGKCSSFDFNEVGFQGKIYAFALLNGTSGSVSSAVALADFTALSAGVTSWSDAAGNSWAITGTSEVSNRRYRFYGEVSAWPQTWTPGGNNARVTISASGLLRRLSQGNIPLQSCMARAYTRAATGVLAPVGYWPCEDGSKSTQLASGIGGTPIVFAGTPPQIGGFSGFACSAALPTVNNGQWYVSLPPYTVQPFGSSSGTDAIVRFLMACPSGGSVNTTVIASVFYTGSTLARVDVAYGSGGGIDLNGYDVFGNQLWTTGYAAFGVDGELLRVSIEIRATASNVYSASFATIPVGGGNALSFGVTGKTGAVGQVTRIVINPAGTGGINGTAIGHISLQTTWDTLFDMSAALSAFNGELAGVRFQRLCSEEGIPFRSVGYVGDTPAMGPQTIETITALLQECADIDQGLWFESRDVLGFVYRNRVSLGNQVAFFSLDYNQDHLSNTLDPTMDDQNVKNDVTVTAQNSGSSSRQQLNDISPLSVTIAGRYDTSVTLNTYQDSQLDSEAGWILHISTVNEPRYTGISVDLANTALASYYYTILNADIGDRITVQNPPLWLPPGLVDQIILGISETLSRKALSEKYNGRPASPWNVAYADDVVYGRADTDGSTLAGTVTASATTLSITTTNPDSPLWTTNSADCPFDIVIGGERITVGAVTGTSSPQSFTGCTRAVNGVSKSQSLGSDVRLYTPSVISI